MTGPKSRREHWRKIMSNGQGTNPRDNPEWQKSYQQLEGSKNIHWNSDATTNKQEVWRIICGGITDLICGGTGMALDEDRGISIATAFELTVFIKQWPTARRDTQPPRCNHIHTWDDFLPLTLELGSDTINVNILSSGRVHSLVPFAVIINGKEVSRASFKAGSRSAFDVV